MTFLLLLLSSSVSFAQEDSLPAYEELLPVVPSFQTSRKRMYVIHKGTPTLYCGCDWADKVVAKESCSLETFDGLRWNRTEAEHVVPASVIGEHFPCWEEGGRSHCEKEDPAFKSAHNDLHNLRPAVGQINLYRSSNSMGLIADEDLEYGTCDFEVDVEADRVEPRPEVRGDIARIYFYMEWQHGVLLSQGQRRLFLHWHREDPVSDTEKELDAAIFERQGNHNPFVD
jgi:deoxyribonuclease-1